MSGVQCLETRIMLCTLPMPQVLLRDVTEAEGAARVFSRWEEVVEGSAGAHPPLSAPARPVAACGCISIASRPWFSPETDVLTFACMLLCRCVCCAVSCRA